MKEKAKNLLKKVKTRRDNVVKLNKQVNLLYKQIANLESLEQDEELFDVIRDANKVQEMNQQNIEKYTAELEKARELDQQRQMNDEVIDDMLNDDEDEDELDDMLKQYENEAASEMKANFNKAEQNANITPERQPDQHHLQADGFDRLMAELMD